MDFDFPSDYSSAGGVLTEASGDPVLSGGFLGLQPHLVPVTVPLLGKV